MVFLAIISRASRTATKTPQCKCQCTVDGRVNAKRYGMNVQKGRTFTINHLCDECAMGSPHWYLLFDLYVYLDLIKLKLTFHIFIIRLLHLSLAATVCIHITCNMLFKYWYLKWVPGRRWGKKGYRQFWNCSKLATCSSIESIYLIRISCWGNKVNKYPRNE